MRQTTKRSLLGPILLAAGIFLVFHLSIASAEDEYLYHYVRSGDTLSGIADRYRVPLKDILESNPGLSTRRILHIGQELKVPDLLGIREKKKAAATLFTPPDLNSKLMTSGHQETELLQPSDSRYEATTYTVKAGDKLSYISQAFQVSTDTLLENNPILEDSKALENLTIIIPANIDLSKKLTGQLVSSISTLYPFQYYSLNEEKRHLIGSAEKPEEISRLNPLGDSSIIRELGSSPTLSFSAPTFGYITSRYGRRWLGFHHGIDIATVYGSPIYAAKGGKVAYAGWAFRYGRLIRIDHPNGISTFYGHCSKLLVKKGDWVAEGQKIGEVGNTGRSTGPHLHFEVRLDGRTINPTAYVAEKIKPEVAVANQPPEEKEDHRTFLVE